MHNGEKIEGQVGGKDKNNLSKLEKKYAEQDKSFKL